jgi:hypothetical protein
MARLTALRRRALAILSADDERPVDDLQIRLPRRFVLVAVDASRMHDDAGDRLKQLGIRRRHFCGCAAAASREGQKDGERQEDAHG